MTDTVKTTAQLLADAADQSLGEYSMQDLRNFIRSVSPYVESLRGLHHFVDGQDYAESRDGIQEAMDDLAASGGGWCWILPTSIDLTEIVYIPHGVRIMGRHGGRNSNVGSDAYGTRLRWTGADGADAVVMITPEAGVDENGIRRAGIENIRLDANNKANVGLSVKSAHFIDAINLTVYNAKEWLAKFEHVTLAGDPDPAPGRYEEEGISRLYVRNFSGRQNETTNGGGLKFLLGDNSNTHFSLLEGIDITHLGTGVGCDIEGADNMTIRSIRTFRISGAAKGIWVHDAAGLDIFIEHMDAGAGGFHQTDSAARTHIRDLDIGNGQDKPVVSSSHIAGMSESIFIPAASFRATTGSPTEAAQQGSDTAAGREYVGSLFDPASIEVMTTFVRMPDDLVYSVVPKVIWAPSTTNANEVRWIFGASPIDDGDQLDETTDYEESVVSATTPGTVDTRITTTFAAVVLTAGKLYRIGITRHGDQAADDYTGDAIFIGLQLDFLRNP